MQQNMIIPSFWTGTAIIGLVACAYVSYQCLLSPLARFPGPFAAKLSKGWRAYKTANGQWHRKLVDLHRKYGHVVRIAPNELSVGDPSSFRKIYKAGNGFNKAACYSVVQGNRPFDLTGERNEKVHSEQRKLVATAYSMSSMVHFESKVNVVIETLIHKLEARCGKTIDLGHWLQMWAFDVIGSISFSQPFGYVESGDDEGVFKRIQNAMGSAAWLMHAGWLLRLHQKLIPICGNWLAVNDRNGYFFQVACREVSGRINRGGDDKDIIGQLLETQKIKPQLKDLDISFMMTSNVFAGSDSTSIAFQSIFYLLLTHPAAHDRLMRELREREEKGELSDPVSFQEAESWSYLQAIIYEAMRLYAPAAFVLDRVVPPEGMMIEDKFVPGNTVVGSSAWVIHRNPEIWGPDVDTFRPERWLDDRKDEYKRYFFAFGGGSRTCIGKNISWLEIGKLVPTLLRHFEMRLENGAVLKEEFCALVFLKGLKVHISRRRV
ncbi:cytochrome P450 [Aspergillus oryzae]|uniref:Cytochrome P450 n=1 Tax=Aspergillus oryzae TaxID=5062 RepID=A0A1S9DCQ7_ASPOZ|nr:cytochrome P450 [Aspergillus oryzae]